MFSTIQLALTPLSFGLLFFLMLLYWGQAAFFSYTKYKKFSFLVFYLSFASITSLLVLRWVESGHFPLSNLYESLLFLSWSFLLAQLVLQSYNTPLGPQDRSNNVSYLQKDEYEFVHLLGAVISPLALISYAFAFINLPKEMQKATSLVPALQSNWLMMHVTIMILSYAALLCGSILSMAFLLIKFTLFRETCPQTSTQNVYGYLKYFSQALIGESTYAIDVQMPGVETLDTSADSRLFHAQTSDRVTDATAHTAGRGNARHGNASFVDPEVLKNLGSEQNEILKDSLKPASKTTARKPLIETAYMDQLRGANGSNQRLFSLCSKLDNLSYRMLGLGFPLLTIGILSGAVWANSAWGSYWSWDPKETWALITWLVFAIYLHARITKGWSGDKPAIIATVGFFVVWFSYLGVNLIGTGLHSYGWFNV